MLLRQHTDTLVLRYLIFALQSKIRQFYVKGKLGLTQLYTLVIRVQQKGSEAIGHIVISQELQIVLTELKLHWELMMDLEKTKCKALLHQQAFFFFFFFLGFSPDFSP